MTVQVQAQIAESTAVELERGLILRHEQEVSLGHDKQGYSGGVVFRLLPEAPKKLSDFTACFSMQLDREPGGDHGFDFLYVQGTTAPLLVIQLSPNGSILLTEPRVEGTMPGGTPATPRTGRAIEVVVSIRRETKQALSGLWIDGVEQTSFAVPPFSGDIADDAVAILGHSTVTAKVSNLRLYNRALTRPEIIALANLHHAPAATHTIALLGSTEAVLMAESGWLDAYLALKSATAPKPITLRNLAWEGDTVWRQDRPLNFGPLTQQLDRVQAQQVVIMLGRQECLERGEAGLADFRTALEALVAKCPPHPVLMGCVPFEAKPAPQRDLSALNATLARYDEILKSVVEARGGTFFDTRQGWHPPEAGWTRDGITLTPLGERLLGDATARALGFVSRDQDDASLTRLRTLAQAKEALWHNYWRPGNWAFLYGDRTTQPSSRDHLNPSVRWFPQELEQYRALITEKENELWKQAKAMGRKLP